jgi:hypothetical protein
MNEHIYFIIPEKRSVVIFQKGHLNNKVIHIDNTLQREKKVIYFY